MTEDRPSDWESRLLAQGIAPERIAAAKAAAGQMAAALDGVAFDPSDPIAPERFLRILAAREEN
ncbi:MAG: hypothetical protein AAF495_23130 [Pseudomonadota bacterium]